MPGPTVGSDTPADKSQKIPAPAAAATFNILSVVKPPSF